MSNRARKYIFAIIAFALCLHMVFGIPLARANAAKDMQNKQAVESAKGDSIPLARGIELIDFDTTNGSDSSLRIRKTVDSTQLDSLRTQIGDVDSLILKDLLLNDSLTALTREDSISLGYFPMDPGADTLAADNARKKKNFLDDVISGQNKDSLVYDVRNKMVYIYRDGDVTYQEMNLKADYMEVNMDTKEIYAYGYTDSLGQKSRPEFLDKGESYTMDTIHYNIDTEKAKIKGVARQEGEGYLIGYDVKKMADNTINIMDGKYTTCENVDHPHFYLAMTRAKVLPGEKVIVAPSYFVMEDVPIYFLGIPFGFFPVTTGRKSGFIVPSFGEEYAKGFFIREGGYYFAFNDYIDATILGGIYTLGSWEGSLQSRYIKRYKYSGGLDVRYSKSIIGEKDDTLNYVNTGSFSVRWNHTQDPKFKPNSTFAASVNFSSSSYSKHGTNNLNDHLNTQTNSSISYSKTWAGKPFSLSTNFQHSQNSRDSTVSLSFPNVVFNVSTVHPFKRKNAVGKERWYEKIQTRYTGTMTNNVTAKENELFKKEMYNKMRNGVKHSIPVSASINLFNYINVSPSFNYNEYWYFRKIEQDWDPIKEARVTTDTTYGFYRLFDYTVSASMSTKVYGMFQFSPTSKIQAIRHVITPSISFSYKPDFGSPKYGYYKPIQSNTDGTIAYYSPYEGNAYGVPGRGESMTMSFSLGNTLEMKVLSDKDTTGMRKIKLIDQFSLSGGYNFLAEKFKLLLIQATLRTTLYNNFGLDIRATFDPYQMEVINGVATRINKFMIKKGKLARLTRASTSFGYTFNSSKSNRPAMNDINSGGVPTPEENEFFNERGITDPNQQRTLMASQYYDFNVPWNLGFNYTFNYINEGARKDIIQTLGFNGSVNLTEKWGVNFSGGYDFENKKLTPGTFTVSRDLHCWQMNFTWVPVGTMKSWSFNISVKSNVLRDIKWDKRSSRYDTLYD